MKGKDQGEDVFEVIDALGVGGFAETYRVRVRDPRLVREWGTDDVAIKVPKTRADEKKLIQELILSSHVTEALRELSESANLVRYLGFEQFADRYVMVMEFVPGGSLRELIGPLDRRSPLPVEHALARTAGILNGLSAIHRIGVFHRDIKPENILMDGDTPKIADLGISTVLHSKEQASTTIGTLAYMSPEVLKGAASFGTDIWAVGVTLYEMLTGAWPFGDENTPVGTMVNLIFESEPLPPSQRMDGVPVWLDDVVLRALRKEPADRFATPDEMHVALSAADGLSARLAAIRSLMVKNDLAAAERAARDLAEQFPGDAVAHRSVGEICNRLYRHAEAIQAFERAIELDPQDPMLHWDLALAMQKVGRGRRAAHQLERAIELGLEPRLQRHATHLLHVLREESV